MDVLDRLRKLQSDFGWSDYRIAKEAGLSPGTVSNVYKRNNIPNITTLEAICKAFNISLSQFFSDNDRYRIDTGIERIVRQLDQIA